MGNLAALQLVDALEWCLDLGVTTVSVYAFSVDNFKRSAAEVATLMALAREKLREILTVWPGRAAVLANAHVPCAGLRWRRAMKYQGHVVWDFPAMTQAQHRCCSVLQSMYCISRRKHCISKRERACGCLARCQYVNRFTSQTICCVTDTCWMHKADAAGTSR